MLPCLFYYVGSCNFLDRCSDLKCPYVHYVLDDARANEESIYFQQRDQRLKVVSPEEIVRGSSQKEGMD